MKVGAVFVDLTTAYDTVRHGGLTCTLGPHDHEDGWQLQLYPYHRKWSKEQVTTPQEQRPTLICPGAPSVQHLHPRPASLHLQKVCIC